MREVAATRESLDDPRIALKAQTNAAALERQVGNLRAAAVLAEDLSRAASRFGWEEGEGMAAWTLAEVHTELQEPGVAAGYLRLTRAHLRAVGNRRWEAIALADLATAELAMGRTDAANRHRGEAIAMGRGLLDPFWEAKVYVGSVPALIAAGRRAS